MMITILMIFFHVAIAQTELTFNIADKPTVFYQYDEARLMSNKPCKSATKGKLCSDFEFLKKMKLPKSEAAMDRSALGSVLCRESLDGIIIIGINPVSKSQNSFCKMDDLMVDIGTINYYGSR